MRHSNRTRGFTLIEIMVVVIVLGILAATIIPQFGGQTRKAKTGRAKADIAQLVNALERFYVDMDRYPTTDEGLRVLADPPTSGARNWGGPYIKHVLNDPWGNPYMYRNPGIHDKTYDLWSRGADGKDGGDPDVTSWLTEEDQGA